VSLQKGCFFSVTQQRRYSRKQYKLRIDCTYVARSIRWAKAFN